MDGGGTALTYLEQIGTRISWQVAPGRMIARSHPKPDPNLDDVYMKRGLILIHIPKNAGTSVEDAIYGYHVRHRTWREVQVLCPRAWQSLPKIAILRDPVDRFLSAFDYLKSGGRNEQDRQFGARMIGDRSIDAFLNRFCKNPSFRATSMRYFHFRPQSDFISDGDVVKVDHLIPFHRIAQGLEKFAGVAPSALKHANKTNGRRSELPQSAADHLRSIYAQDAALFTQTCQMWKAESCQESCT